MHTTVETSPGWVRAGQGIGTPAAWARSALSLLAMGACVLAAGCQSVGVATVWKAEAPSPDGHYIAIVRTMQHGGFGSAGVVTSVSVEQATVPRTRTTVLSFSCKGPVPHPYTLDNKANAGGTIDLAMKWLTPTHLEVTYNGRDGTLNFQAVKYQGIHISLKDLSNNATSQTRHDRNTANAGPRVRSARKPQ